MLKTIYLIHHSHTDIGYTHPQPTVRYLHVGHINQALREIEATRGFSPDAQMRWTCETLLPVFDWWKQATTSEREHFLHLESEGLLEVTGMWSIGTLCSPPRAWEWMMDQVEWARSEMGVRIRSAMLSDINGAPWATPDYLKSHGIDNFLMGINEYFGKSNLPRLFPFSWRGPKGGIVNAFNGFHYNNNQYFGIPYSIEESIQGIVRLEKYLTDRDDFDFEFSLFQVTRPDFNDNNGPDSQLPKFVAEWNARGLQPAMKIVTLTGFFGALGTDFFKSRPQLSGEWSDFWNLGAASTPYETALNRETYRVIEAVENAPHKAREEDTEDVLLEEAMENAVVYDEHTWGSDYPVSEPHSYATQAGRHFKNNFAFRAHDAALRARAVSLMCMLSHTKEIGETPHLLVANPHDWAARKTFEVPTFLLVQDVCPTPAHFHRLQYKPLTLPPVSTPEAPLPLPEGMDISDTLRFEVDLQAREAKVLSRNDIFSIAVPSKQMESTFEAFLAIIENNHFTLRLDSETGGLGSLVCRKSGRELLRGRAAWPQGVPLSEEPLGGTREELYECPDWTQFLAPKGFLTDWKPAYKVAAAHGAVRLIRSAGRSTLNVGFSHPACRSLSVAWSLDESCSAVHVEVTIDFERDIKPRTWYWPMLFEVDSPGFEYDSCGSAVRLGLDQLPNSNMDFFTVHRWVRVGMGDSSMLVFPVDTPLAMMGGLHIGRLTSADTPREPFFAGLLHSNYWPTNYAASCDGQVCFRFFLMPGAGAPSAGEANRVAAELTQAPIFAPFVPAKWRPAK